MQTDTTPTCLFTGVALSPTTKEEHTILRSLGGRIRSRIVSSDQFNNDCGSFLDSYLKAPYSLILNKLAPLMSTEHAQGLLGVNAPGEPDGIVLQPGGAATRKGLSVTSRDPTSQLPKTAMSADESALRKLAKQIGKEDEMQLSTTPATEALTFYRSAPVILAELEIAALKCALLSFDHALAGEDNRFTRSDLLEEVRTFVADAVRTRSIDGERCNQYSLGMQYDRLEMYQQLRSQVDFPKSDFEHVLFVASNQACRCLDLVWIVFGFDPFGFRLSRRWNGPQIEFALVNGVLRGSTASNVHGIRCGDDLLCAPTSLRAFADTQPEPEERDAIINQVAKRRNEAYGKAVLLVEKQADDLLRQNFIEAAALKPSGTRSLSVLVLDRLTRMFGRRKDDPDFSKEVSTAVNIRVEAMPNDMRAQAIDGPEDESAVAWDEWISVYRKCLDKLVDDFGLPGDIFVNTTESGVEHSGERKLGQPHGGDKASST